jgi:S-adenosylmethionine-diacylglycerol 3-amino-3-carboxypropyl transferase
VTRIEERASFEAIRYANVWEDASILCQALAPLAGKKVLSIASGGDNAFALAADGAAVVAADLSSAQLAVVELKRAAILRLDYDDLLSFLGVTPSADRMRLWADVAPALPHDARAWWDARQETIARGIVHAGRFERYFETFRRFVVPLFHDRRTVAELLREKSREERERFYQEVWDNRRWRLLFRIFFSRAVMGRLGRDPEFFRFVEGDVAGRILARTRYAFTVLPTHQNPYLQFIFNGNYGPALPRYLEPKRYAVVRNGCERITLVRGGVDAAAASHGPFDRFNLSDLFEYLDPSTTEAVYRKILDASRPGSRIAYWNMLAPRRRPESLAGRVRSLDGEAAELHARDLAFFYSAFVLEEVA